MLSYFYPPVTGKSIFFYLIDFSPAPWPNVFERRDAALHAQRRYATVMFSMDDYTRRKIGPQDLLNLVKPGNRIFLSSGTTPARAVREILSSGKHASYDLAFIQLFAAGEFPPPAGCEFANYRLISFRTGELSVDGVCRDRFDYIPSNQLEIPYIFATDTLPIDIAIIATSPPDERGYLSLGIAVDVAQIVMRKADIVIAEVNPNVPVTFGETSIHCDQVHHIFESDEPLPERKPLPFGPELDRIGWHISNLIQDGSTVVLHAGRLFDAAASHMKTKKNLGVYTNVVSDWVIDLIESGAVAFDREREKGGQVTTSYCYGTRRLYDYVKNNQLFGFYPAAKLADPYRMKAIPNLISIMNVETIDITAASVVFRSGDDLLSGYESKFNFAVGTAFSGTGRVIYALRAADGEGNSNIVVSHSRDSARLRSTLGVIRYVVTEYGVANLFGKPLRERALALIDIAHPDHRERLLAEAKEAGLIYPDQIYETASAVNYPPQYETRKSFKDSLELYIRPIKPSDEEMMRRLFYTFSDESKYLRYFTNVRTMPHKNMQKYVNIDYQNILALVALQQKGNTERIVAEARFATVPGGAEYDMAFLVDEDFQGRGIASFMLEYLIRIARERGIKTLTADVLPQNRKMLGVFERASLKPTVRGDEGSVKIEYHLE